MSRKIPSRFLAKEVSFGQSVRDLVAQVGSGAKLARSIGVSPSTVYRWMERDEPPSTLEPGSDLRTTLLRRERYYYNERPERLKNKPALPSDTSFINLPREERSEVVGSLESRNDSGVFAFDLTEDNIRDFDRIVREGVPLVFTVNAQEDILQGPNYKTVTIPTAGRSKRAILSHFYRSMRSIINRQVREKGASDVSLVVVAVQAISHAA